MKKMIVKVQISMFSTHGASQILVYSKGRKNWYEGEATKEQLAAMDGELKKFFWANVPTKPGDIELLEEAPWQEW